MDEKLLKHGGRLRANEIEAKIREYGFEKGVKMCLEALAVRDGTLHQEIQNCVQAIMQLTDNLSQLADVLGIHGDELIRLKGLDNAVSNTHPDEGH
jgi:hypothetical protein